MCVMEGGAKRQVSLVCQKLTQGVGTHVSKGTVTPGPRCGPLSCGWLPLLEPWQQLPANGHGSRCTIVAGCSEPSVQKAREVSRSY